VAILQDGHAVIAGRKTTMDWKTLFLSPYGRIGQRDFIIAFLMLLFANIVIGNLGTFSFLGILLFYPGVCVVAKRLHDFGKSGWLILVPLLGTFGAGVAAGIGGAAAIFAVFSGSVSGIGALGLAGVLLLGMVAVVVLSIGFIVWVLATPSDGSDNVYGPTPVKLITAF
jgi:uncharacterized membrane protein YhaH (DUF805 family)